METLKRFFKSAELILAYFVISILLQVLYILMDIENEAMTSLALILISVIAAGLVVCKLRRQLKGQVADFRKNMHKYIKIALQNWAVGFVLMIIANGILMSLLGGMAPNEEANREIADMYLIYSLVYTCVIAPIAEELLFRLNFKGTFKNKKVFIWVTAAMFGAMHVIGNVAVWTDILYIFPYMILGYYFSKTYVQTGNIYASIFAHMFHNSLAMLIIMLGI